MPLGFTPGTLGPVVERYGDRLAQGIIQSGQMIEDGLKRVTTQKQLVGLGQTLSQLDPSTPDYPQKLIAIAPQFPEALRDPRGQALMSIGAKQHFQWQQSQAATQRMQTQFGNNVALENLRNRHQLGAIEARNAGRANSEVDLSGLPSTLTPQNPAQGVAPIGPTQSGTPMGAPAGDGNEELMGMSGGLGDNAAPPTADPLLARALGPLREAQQFTGVKPTKTQVFGAISAERTRAQQAALQEDRQAQQDKVNAAKDTARAAADEGRAARAENVQKRLILNSQLANAEKDVSQHRAALEKHLASKGDRDEEFYAQKKEFERVLQEAGAERERLNKELNSIGKDTDTVFKDEAAARAAGHDSGEVVIILNPKTGKPAKARLE